MKTVFELLRAGAGVSLTQDKQGNKLLATATLSFDQSFHFQKEDKWETVFEDVVVRELDAYLLLSLRRKIDKVLEQSAFKDSLQVAQQRLAEDED